MNTCFLPSGTFFPNQYIQDKRNERVQKELDEQKEKLEKAKAEHTRLKSSAVGSDHCALSETYTTMN